jgi:glycine cleavage system protein P-like pyridoxal-binding family
MAEQPRTIFERSVAGRRAYSLPALDVPEADAAELIPPSLLRDEPPLLPEVSELELVRHYVNLSQRNFSIDGGFYPLGSCTMKYNPKVHEQVAAMPGFALLHPLQEEDGAQGALRLLEQLERWICELAGLPHATLQPAAGAHGEWTGLMLIRAYHEARGQERGTIVIPDTAHGTNPASVTLAGYRPLAVRTAPGGGVDLDDLRRKVDGDTAGLMLTNPNTLGVYDENIVEVARVFHDAGALLYYDGANLNAVMGISRPGDMGFDIVHLNTHKSFSTPHGGGGRASARSRATGATSACSCAPTPTSARSARAGCATPRRAPSSMPTTCSRGCARPTTCPSTAPARTSSCSRRDARSAPPAYAPRTSPSGSWTSASTRRRCTSHCWSRRRSWSSRPRPRAARRSIASPTPCCASPRRRGRSRIS